MDTKNIFVYAMTRYKRWPYFGTHRKRSEWRKLIAFSLFHFSRVRLCLHTFHSSQNNIYSVRNSRFYPLSIHIWLNLGQIVIFINRKKYFFLLWTRLMFCHNFFFCSGVTRYMTALDLWILFRSIFSSCFPRSLCAHQLLVFIDDQNDDSIQMQNYNRHFVAWMIMFNIFSKQ